VDLILTYQREGVISPILRDHSIEPRGRRNGRDTMVDEAVDDWDEALSMILSDAQNTLNANCTVGPFSSPGLRRVDVDGADSLAGSTFISTRLCKLLECSRLASI